MSDDVTLSRRRLLKLLGVGAAGGLAGCVEQSDEPLEPTFDENRLSDWLEVTGIRTEGKETVRYLQRRKTIRYKTVGQSFARDVITERLREALPQGAVPPETASFPIMFFGGAKTRTNPPAAGVKEVVPDPEHVLLDKLDRFIRDKVSGYGVESVEERNEKPFTVGTEETGRVRTYDMVFPYSETEIPIGSTTATIESGEFDIEGKIAMWFHNGVIATTFGTFPNESGEIELTAGGETETLDLGFTPSEYRSSVVDLMKSLD